MSLDGTRYVCGAGMLGRARQRNKAKKQRGHKRAFHVPLGRETPRNVRARNAEYSHRGGKDQRTRGREDQRSRGPENRKYRIMQGSADPVGQCVCFGQEPAGWLLRRAGALAVRRSVATGEGADEAEGTSFCFCFCLCLFSWEQERGVNTREYV